MTHDMYIHAAPPQDISPDDLERAINSATEKAEEAIEEFWRSMEGRPDSIRFAAYVAANLVDWVRCRVDDYASEAEVRERELILAHVASHPGLTLNDMAEWMTNAGRDEDEYHYLMEVGRLQRRTDAGEAPAISGSELAA